MKTYYEIKVKTIPFNPDLISGLFWEAEIEGIEEKDNYLKVFTSKNLNRITTQINQILNNLKSENLIESFECSSSEIENINWNEEWEKRLGIIKISDKIVIKPTFKKYTAQKDEVIIEMNPKMSFGTGEHQTTKLVLQYLENYALGKKSMLDVGSGTGILSIAASKLGCESIIGIDNDEWCLNNGIENIKINKVENKVDIRLNEIDKICESDFDLITANINMNVLINIADKIKSRIRKGGILILSGLLISDEDKITEIYSSLGFKKIESKKMDEWISIVFNYLG